VSGEMAVVDLRSGVDGMSPAMAMVGGRRDGNVFGLGSHQSFERHSSWRRESEARFERLAPSLALDGEMAL